MSNSIHNVIDENPIGSLQWRVVSICFFLALVDGFDAMSIAYVAPVLEGQFGIPPDTMGKLISSALVGLMLGALIGSPLADRFGRKPIIVVSTTLMGAFSLITAWSNSVEQLFVYRFLTGLGLGGLMPTINVLTAEFAPSRRRALLMTAMYTGLPIGTIVGGVTAAGIIDQFGWQSVFVVGGVIPLLMLPVLVLLLPESPHFLASKPDTQERLAKIMRQIATRTPVRDDQVFEPPVANERGSIVALFTEGRSSVTLLLWLLFFANLLTLNAIIGWLPSLLGAAGFPLNRAILVTILFSIGGVGGGLLISMAIDRVGPTRVMIGSYLAATLFVSLVGYSTQLLPVLMSVLFLAGAFTMGSQFGLNALASSRYDTHSRATGLGWALAVGRLGGIGGPILIGAALASGFSLATLFILGATPMFVSALAVFALARIGNSEPS